MSRAVSSVLLVVSLVLAVPRASAAGRRIAHPLGEIPDTGVSAGGAGATPTHALAIQAIDPATLRQILNAGSAHIVAQQCSDGGFGWPHADCSTTYQNITAPILLGVLNGYAATGDTSFIAAASRGGDFEMACTFDNGDPRFGTFSAYYLLRLSAMSSNSTYATHAAKKFFDELEAGTYGPTDLDTAGFIAAVVAGRAGAYVNLVPWEFHTLVTASKALGHPDQPAAFVQGILDGLDAMDNTNPSGVPWDLIGVAGAVGGLARGGMTTFPAITAPLHSGINGIDSLEGLAGWLVSQQNADGSWNWASNLTSPGTSDEDTQTTAYAVLALEAAAPVVGTSYSAAIGAGRDWLASMQLPNGGFASYPGGGENTEVEGEALWALGGSGMGRRIPSLDGRGIAALMLLLVAAGAWLLWRRVV